jgi:hypothetical protein
MSIRTEAQKRMLRAVIAGRERGREYMTLAEIGGSPYIARTASALVRAGYLEQAPGGSQMVYRATSAAVEWFARDSERDSLGRRRGGPRPRVPPEVVDRARQLLGEKTEQGKFRYNLQEVADQLNLNRHTLAMYLFPYRRKRRSAKRRENYKRGI